MGAILFRSEAVAVNPIRASGQQRVQAAREGARSYADPEATLTDPLECDENGDAAVVVRSFAHPELFAELYHRYAADIHRFCGRRLGDGAADDVTAETFLTAFRTRRRFDTDRASARSWLYGIAAGLIDRQRRAEVRALESLAATGYDPVAESRADRAVRAPLAAALAGLSTGDRHAVLLAGWADLGDEDVAEALGVDVAAVRDRLARARRTLRAALGYDGVPPEGPYDDVLPGGPYGDEIHALRNFRADASRPDRARLAPGRRRLLDTAAAAGGPLRIFGRA